MTVIALPVPAKRAGDEESDASLVRAMAASDAGALRQLYERHGRSLLAYLVGQLGERQLAEEVLQDVMLAAWNAAPAFRGESAVRTWLFAIAHNRAVNAQRRRPRVLLVDPSAIRGVRTPRRSAADRADDCADVRAALRTIPGSQRAAIDLVFAQGLTVVEAAEVLDVAPGTIKSRLHRARALLRERLDPNNERVM